MSIRRWMLPVCLALAAIVGTSCQLDELLSPAALQGLFVEPAALADSAPLGSTAPRTRVIALTSAETMTGATLRASVAGNSKWLELGRTRDTVPSTLTVSLNPAGL